MKTYLVLFTLISIPSVAGTLSLELRTEAESERKIKYLAEPNQAAVDSKLTTEAAKTAIKSLVSQCMEMRGRVSEVACLRDLQIENVQKWGGRVGYRARVANVLVSLTCVVDEDQFNWAESLWYPLIFSHRSPCPEAQTFEIEDFL